MEQARTEIAEKKLLAMKSACFGPEGVALSVRHLYTVQWRAGLRRWLVELPHG